MAICNLIKPLDKNNTGKFIMFSQYTEDLTKNNAEGFKYHVVPSKFIAAYIQYALNDEAVDWNEHIALILQNHFENGCAVCKNNKDIKWTPDMSANLFWNTMINQGIITTLKNKGDGTRVEWNSVKEFMYVNDINVQSYDVIDGMGYSEVYCYIPNDAKRIDYEISTVNANPRNIKSESNHLEGYPNKIVDNLRAINYSVDKTVEFQYENPKLGYKVNDNKEFDVNTIIVLYDINSVDDKGNVINLYKNIPMGIYLPGPDRKSVV